MQKLTEKQKNILDFIEDFVDKYSVSPSVSEIADHFDIKISTAFAHLRALQRKKEISRNSTARSISLLNRPKRLSGMIRIPLVGRVVAGIPVDNPELREGEIWVSGKFGDPAKLFALKVQGESMRDLGIFDSDTLIVLGDARLRSGDVVVALTRDGETTVKSYYPAGNRVELRPANPDFKSRTYSRREIAVQGKVVGLIREL